MNQRKRHQRRTRGQPLPSQQRRLRDARYYGGVLWSKGDLARMTRGKTQPIAFNRIMFDSRVTVLSEQVLEVTRNGGKTTARAVPDGLTKPKRP